MQKFLHVNMIWFCSFFALLWLPWLTDCVAVENGLFHAKMTCTGFVSTPCVAFFSSKIFISIFCCHCKYHWMCWDIWREKKPATSENMTWNLKNVHWSYQQNMSKWEKIWMQAKIQMHEILSGIGQSDNCHKQIPKRFFFPFPHVYLPVVYLITIQRCSNKATLCLTS